MTKNLDDLIKAVYDVYFLEYWAEQIFKINHYRHPDVFKKKDEWLVQYDKTRNVILDYLNEAPSLQDALARLDYTASIMKAKYEP